MQALGAEQETPLSAELCAAAWVSGEAIDQLLPFQVSLSAAVTPPAPSLKPTATHDLADGQEMPSSSAFSPSGDLTACALQAPFRHSAA